MKVSKILSSAIVLMSLLTTGCNAEEGMHQEQKGSMGGHEEKGSRVKHMKEDPSFAVEVGNKICPVTGAKTGTMGPAVQHEYKGKIYNFCCTGCVETFKDNPEKYVKIIEDQLGQNKEIVLAGDHEKHQHEMGEMDKYIAMEPETVEDALTITREVDPAIPVKEFNLEAYQFSYSPEIITVKKGDLVKIHAISRDIPHGVFIKEYGINEKVEKGKIQDIEFVADKTGEFDIICSIYCGRGHGGMRAQLIVEG